LKVPPLIVEPSKAIFELIVITTPSAILKVHF
jgi:hypothetical protein